MEKKTNKYGRSAELIYQLQRMMFLRALVVTFFLGITILFQFKSIKSLFVPSLIPFYQFTGAVYFLTLLYSVALQRVRNLLHFAHLQIGLDVVLVTILIYLTGGIASAFSFVYFLPIIAAAIMEYRKGALFTASFSSIMYGAAIDLEYFGYIRPIYSEISGTLYYGRGYVFYLLLINIGAFYIVAYLSSYLAEKEKHITRKLRRKEEDYNELATLHKNIVESISSGILTTDLDGRINFANRAAETILKIPAEELSRIELNQILDRLDNFRKFPRKRKVKRLEGEYKRTDGKTIYLGMSISDLNNNQGKKIGQIVIFQNLTELKEMERAIKRSERLAAIGQLAAGIAHEIRNPLAAVSGSIQLLSKALKLDGAEKHLMQIVVRESSRLDSLISNFLSFARPDRIVPGKFELKTLVEEIVEVLKNDNKLPENIDIRIKADGTTEIIADQQQIRQVIWNLFINAIQAMPEGGRIFVEIEPASMNMDGDALTLKISDTGTGIDSKDIDQIFNPFFTTKSTGSGLGLSVVHRIVENHGGHITVSSKKGKGTTFTIYLPKGRKDA